MENGDFQTAQTNFASHGRPPNRIAGLRRQMQTRGMSPRPANTEYYKPLIRDETAGVLPPLELDGLPVFSLWPETAAVSAPAAERISAEPDPPRHASSDENISSESDCPPPPAPSPSVARSPPSHTPRTKTPPAPRVASNTVASCFESLGLTPFRTVSFRKTGDELILATSIYSHRVAVYVPRERAVPLRNRGKLFAGLPSDLVAEHMITEREDLDKYGAKELCYAAGAAADGVEASVFSHILGVLAATTNPQNPRSTRYFALLCQAIEEPEAGSQQKEIDLHIYAETEAATLEFRNRHRHALFSRAQAVIPIIHLSTVEKEAARREGMLSLADCIRNAVSKCEVQFMHRSFENTDHAIVRRLDRIYAITERMRELAPECSLTRASATEACLAQIKAPSNDCASASARVRELGLYSVHLQEAVGAYLTRVESALSEAEAAAESALANLYCETRIVVCPEPVTRSEQIAKAERWGYPIIMDGLSVMTPPGGGAFLDKSEEIPPHVATAMRHLIAAREEAA